MSASVLALSVLFLTFWLLTTKFYLKYSINMNYHKVFKFTIYTIAAYHKCWKQSSFVRIICISQNQILCLLKFYGGDYISSTAVSILQPFRPLAAFFLLHKIQVVHFAQTSFIFYDRCHKPRSHLMACIYGQTLNCLEHFRKLLTLRGNSIFYVSEN